jgi:hypothetical protein
MWFCMMKQFCEKVGIYGNILVSGIAACIGVLFMSLCRLIECLCFSLFGLYSSSTGVRIRRINMNTYGQVEIKLQSFLSWQ